MIETRDRPGHEFVLLWSKLCNPQLVPFLPGKIIFVNCKRRAWELDASSQVGAGEVFLLNHPHPTPPSKKRILFPAIFAATSRQRKNPLVNIQRFQSVQVKNYTLLRYRSCEERSNFIAILLRIGVETETSLDDSSVFTLKVFLSA